MIFHVCNVRSKDTTTIFMTMINKLMMSVSFSFILIPKADQSLEYELHQSGA